MDAVHVGGPFAGAGPAPPAYPVQDPFAIPAAAPATGNPFAAPAMNPLAYGELLLRFHTKGTCCHGWILVMLALAFSSCPVKFVSERGRNWEIGF